jgi:hypothetical protein
MKIFPLIAASLMPAIVLNVTLGPAAARAENLAAAHFPSIAASNLEKRDFNLPADFEGDRNLLLIAFERDQQKDVDTWLRQMKQFEALDSRFRYYELPTIQRPSAITRWFIDTGMRHGIPDLKERERTITLYLDRKPFCDALLISDQKTIYALLVDRQGKVLWRSEGTFDESKGASLRGALEKHDE